MALLNEDETRMPDPHVVTFDYDLWRQVYPGLAQNVSAEAGQFFFDQACLIFNNSPRSPERDVKVRRTLLYLLTAHIAQISTPVSGCSGSSGGGLVGRISSASRGSVSVSAEAPDVGAGAGWFSQTQWGLTFWQMTLKYRQMRTIPGRSHPAFIWP